MTRTIDISVAPAVILSAAKNLRARSTNRERSFAALRMTSRLVVLLVAVIAAVCPRLATAQPDDLRKNVGFDQRLDEQLPLDLTFTDEAGNSVTLGDYFGKKPVILVLAYYRCPMLCTQVLNGLTKALREMPFTAGKEFNVLTVSFDPRETPDLAAAKKNTYVNSYGRAGAEEGWHFLTGKQQAIDALTKAIGFRYVYDAPTDQFIHTAGIVILTPQGKISRYFRDIAFSARDVRLGLVEASASKIGSPTDEILLYCFHYDPATGKYSASILNFVRAGGVLTVVVLVGMVLILWRRNPRSSRHTPCAVTGNGTRSVPANPESAQCGPHGGPYDCDSRTGQGNAVRSADPTTGNGTRSVPATPEQGERP